MAINIDSSNRALDELGLNGLPNSIGDGRVDTSFEVCPLSIQKVKGVVRDYRDYLETRYNLYYKVPQSDASEDNKIKDKIKKDEYVNVLSLLQLVDNKENLQHCLVYTVKEVVHGILTVKEDKPNKKLCVSCLVTAPWNLGLAAPNQDEHTQIKGVGKALMQAAYKLAQKKQLHSIALRAMNDSQGFYNRIGMVPKGLDMILSVEPSQLPAALFSNHSN